MNTFPNLYTQQSTMDFHWQKVENRLQHVFTGVSASRINSSMLFISLQEQQNLVLTDLNS
jgi:hypothetical protein